MSSSSIWSKAPQSIRQPPPEGTTSALKNTFVVEERQKQETKQKPMQQRNYSGTVPAGQKCIHGKWQPEAIETVRAKVWTCYECTFICAKCGLNSVGLCDSYDCS
jgi:hypothetical protein